MTQKPVVVEIAMEIALPHAFLETIAKKFGPEKARECAMSTSVGGIGPLLRERIIEQSHKDVDVIGVTLLYESVWIQAWHEWGQINLQKRGVGAELRSCLTHTDLGFELELFDGKKVQVEVWSLTYGKSPVYFLAVPEINSVVYPGPKDAPAGTHNAFTWSHEIRLKQSWIVGRGALALSEKLNRKPSLMVLSETPAIFTHHGLCQDSFQKNPFFNDTKYIFNDHTPLEYAHPIWDQHTIDMVRLDPSIYTQTPGWNANKKVSDITSMLVSRCDGVFGVAKKHGDVMKAMPSLKILAEKIRYITNGVLKEEWQAPDLHNFKDLPDAEIIAIKQKYKEKLLDWAWRHCRQWPGWAKESAKRNIVLWTRRITPYKRLDLLVKMLQNKEMYEKFMNLNVLLFVGGRIHQQDNHAQDIVYDLLEILSKDDALQKRVIPVDNFNVWEAPLLFKGTDGAIMLADDTREASATGFMKAQMNGAAILATSDGAVPEFVDSTNGFDIPYIKGEPTPQGLLNAFVQFDAALSMPENRLAIIKAALAETPNVSVERTVNETIQLYQDVLNHAPVQA